MLAIACLLLPNFNRGKRGGCQSNKVCCPIAFVFYFTGFAEADLRKLLPLSLPSFFLHLWWVAQRTTQADNVQGKVHS